MTVQELVERIHEIAATRSEPPAITPQADAQRDFQEIERLSAEALAEMADAKSSI